MADAFDTSKINKIYLGKDNCCRCGCGGDYVERAAPLFEKRLKRFTAMWADYELQKFDEGDNFLNLSYGNNRAMTVYFD